MVDRGHTRNRRTHVQNHRVCVCACVRRKKKRISIWCIRFFTRISHAVAGNFLINDRSTKRRKANEIGISRARRSRSHATPAVFRSGSRTCSIRVWCAHIGTPYNSVLYLYNNGLYPDSECAVNFFHADSHTHTCIQVNLRVKHKGVYVHVCGGGDKSDTKTRTELRGIYSICIGIVHIGIVHSTLQYTQPRRRKCSSIMQSTQYCILYVLRCRRPNSFIFYSKTLKNQHTTKNIITIIHHHFHNLLSGKIDSPQLISLINRLTPRDSS